MCVLWGDANELARVARVCVEKGSGHITHSAPLELAGMVFPLKVEEPEAHIGGPISGSPQPRLQRMGDGPGPSGGSCSVLQGHWPAAGLHGLPSHKGEFA